MFSFYCKRHLSVIASENISVEIEGARVVLIRMASESIRTRLLDRIRLFTAHFPTILRQNSEEMEFSRNEQLLNSTLYDYLDYR